MHRHGLAQSHIKRVTRGCDSQSNDVWPREETSSLSAYAEQDEERKAKESHTRIRRRRSDPRDVRVCAQLTKRNRTIDTGREGTPYEVQEQTAPYSKYEIVHSSKRREIQQTSGFLPALIAPLAATVFLPLLSQLLAYMSHVRKMALVDPRLLETLPTPTKTSVDTTLRDLDAEMTSILDKSDVDVSEKVRLYNHALLLYNDMAKDRAAKPTPVVVMKENEPIVATGVMADVVTTLPKTLQEKGSQLVSRLKTTKWNYRGELLHEWGGHTWQ